jgi:Tfp pilus assembly protein PilX
MTTNPLRRSRPRRGFTLLIALCVLALIAAAWAAAGRVVTSMVAIEAARADRVRADTGRVYAVAALEKAMAHLQNSLPPARKTYSYTVDLGRVDKSANNYYTVRFDPNDGLRGTTAGWRVQVVPRLSPSCLALPAPQDKVQWPASPP